MMPHCADLLALGRDVEAVRHMLGEAERLRLEAAQRMAEAVATGGDSERIRLAEWLGHNGAMSAVAIEQRMRRNLRDEDAELASIVGLIGPRRQTITGDASTRPPGRVEIASIMRAMVGRVWGAWRIAEPSPGTWVARPADQPAVTRDVPAAWAVIRAAIMALDQGSGVKASQLIQRAEDDPELHDAIEAVTDGRVDAWALGSRMRTWGPRMTPPIRCRHPQTGADGRSTRMRWYVANS